MYEFISGSIAHKDTNYLVVETAGIGYKIYVDSYTLGEVKKGESAVIYTFLKVAEAEFTLYGFKSKDQRNMFEKLIGVSGIGPKAAIAILSTLKVEDIAAAIISNDSAAFTHAPGVGKKTAQRLVLELKEKVDFQEAVGDGTEESFAGGADAAADACAALVGLGYNRQEAMKAVAAVKALGDTAEELVGLALKRMGR